MNTTNQEKLSNFFCNDVIRGYQDAKAFFEQRIGSIEVGNNQQNNSEKGDSNSEKLVTNLTAGIGRLISISSDLPKFGWGRGFFANQAQLVPTKVRSNYDRTSDTVSDATK